MSEFSPREIVSELDRFVVGHAEAKRAVAVALRNRWRRQRVPEDLRDEITPEEHPDDRAHRRRQDRDRPAAGAAGPGAVPEGRGDQVHRGRLRRPRRRPDRARPGRDRPSPWSATSAAPAVRAKAEAAAEERILDALVGPGAGPPTRDSFRKKLRAGELDDKEVELTLADTASPFQGFDIPGQPGASMGVLNLSDMMGKAFGQRTKTHKTTVAGAWAPLIAEESDKLLDQEAADRRRRCQLAENSRHRLHRRDRQGGLALRARRRRRLPRGRAARPAAADRGHDGLDQVRAGEDRPHPVHRLGRLPRRQALGPAARAAGPPADPGGAEGADAATTCAAS